MATRDRKRKTSGSRHRVAADAAQGQLLNTVHQVWLAGLGAMAKAQTGAPRLFDELVREGARMYASTTHTADKAMRTLVSGARSAIEARVSGARELASDTLENLEKMFQERVQRVLHQMGVPGTRELDKLSARVDMLNANIEKLARRRAGAKRAADSKRASAPPSSAAH